MVNLPEANVHEFVFKKRRQALGGTEHCLQIIRLLFLQAHIDINVTLIKTFKGLGKRIERKATVITSSPPQI